MPLFLHISGVFDPSKPALVRVGDLILQYKGGRVHLGGDPVLDVNDFAKLAHLITDFRRCFLNLSRRCLIRVRVIKISNGLLLQADNRFDSSVQSAFLGLRVNAGFELIRNLVGLHTRALWVECTTMLGQHGLVVGPVLAHPWHVFRQNVIVRILISRIAFEIGCALFELLCPESALLGLVLLRIDLLLFNYLL